ncbi:MAG TPA: TraB/GumN family protein, partial [Pseudomonadales bacterium]|nr:TraB/GumN family protein [Pseudomonadales bacterium]
MKRICALFFGLFFVSLSQLAGAEGFSGSTLWKIEKQIGGRQTTNYVFGTVHLPDSRVGRFPSNLESSLSQVNTVVLEVILDPETMKKIGRRMQADRNRSIDAVLTPEQLKKLNAALNKRGLTMEAVKPLKPWLIATQLMLPPRSSDVISPPLEMQLSTYAASHKAALAQLETADEQLDLFDTLPESDQVELLMSSVNT